MQVADDIRLILDFIHGDIEILAELCTDSMVSGCFFFGGFPSEMSLSDVMSLRGSCREM